MGAGVGHDTEGAVTSEALKTYENLIMNTIAFTILVVSMFAFMLINTSNAQKPLEDKPLNGNCHDADENGHVNIAVLYPDADRIQQYQYYNCSSVKSVTFPDATFSIGQEIVLSFVSLGTRRGMMKRGMVDFLNSYLWIYCIHK